MCTASRGPSQWATRGNSSRRKKKTRRWPKPASGSSRTALSAGIISICRRSWKRSRIPLQHYRRACVRFSGAGADMVGIMSFLPLNELPALFPHVMEWISYLEKQAQESGRVLTPIEFNLAQNVGVVHPGEVRILL